MSMFKNITRGGQLQIHQLRMFHQIFNFAFVISLVITLSFVAFHINKEMQETKGQYAYEYICAKFLIGTVGKFSKISEITQTITLGDGSKIKATSINVIRSEKIIRAAHERYRLLILKLKQASGVFICSFMLIFMIWFKYGQNQKKTDITKGKNLVTIEQLARELKKDKIDSDIVVEGLPLVKNSETGHILVTGTTGCGKSNLFNIILPQIRKRPNRAIIVDVTGAYVSKFYNPETDLIFNPLDLRTVNWNIWADCHYESHYESFAASIIPEKKGSYDDVWDKSARLALVELMKKLKDTNDSSVKNLFNLLNKKKMSSISLFLQDTPASKLFAKEAEKTAFSVLMNLMAQIAPLKYLLDDTINPFSMRSWIEDESNNNSWLFITSRTDQIDALKPLISSITDIAINAMLSLNPDERRRLWFIIDELPKLNKLPSLITALAESRKYGGCIMAGIQSIPQLTEIYGYSISQIMLDMFNSFFFFRCQNPQTTQFVSTILGVVEQEEHHEQMSYGASSMKDGVSFSKQARSKSLVLPTEIANLKNLEAYVKYASHDLTNLKMKYHELPTTSPGFILQEKEIVIKTVPISGEDESNQEQISPSNESINKVPTGNNISIIDLVEDEIIEAVVIDDSINNDASIDKKELLNA